MTQAKNREELTNWEDIPEFETEEEEQAFWDNHCLGDNTLEQMQPVADHVFEEWRKAHEAD